MFQALRRMRTTPTTSAVFRAWAFVTWSLLLPFLRFPSFSKFGSIKLKLLFPRFIINESVFTLLALHQHIVFHYQTVHLSTHETGISLFRSANDRFPAHVERGVDYHWTLRNTFELLDGVVIDRIVFTTNG